MRPFLVLAAVLACASGMEGAPRSVADDATRPFVSFGRGARRCRLTRRQDVYLRRDRGALRQETRPLQGRARA